MLDSLSGVLGSTEEDGVGSGGGLEGELIKGEDLSSGLQDTGVGSAGDAEGSNGDLGDIKKTNIIGDGSDNNGDLVFLSLHVANQA